MQNPTSPRKSPVQNQTRLPLLDRAKRSRRRRVAGAFQFPPGGLRLVRIRFQIQMRNACFKASDSVASSTTWLVLTGPIGTTTQMCCVPLELLCVPLEFLASSSAEPNVHDSSRTTGACPRRPQLWRSKIDSGASTPNLLRPSGQARTSLQLKFDTKYV